MANKGEWGEPYVALRLLGEGRLYLADENGLKNPNEWMKIIELIRNETVERVVTYQYSADETLVNINVNDDYVISVIAKDFLNMADLLASEIKEKTGRSFDVSDEIKSFLEKIEIKALKAQSVDKSDIFLSVSDPRTTMVRNKIGFSIKTKFGKDPTLFNTAKASAVKYEIEHMNDDIMNQVNNLFNDKGEVSVIDRCSLIISSGCTPIYAGYVIASRARCEAFKENLQIINPMLPSVIERILWYHFFENFSDKDISAVIKKVILENPCRITRPEVKYPYMMKSFLYAAYCGMTASTLWDGKSRVNGGFISVEESGEILAYYALESENFKSYLYNNCYLEFPATSSGHGDYGKVYKDKETGKYYFNLNFQIRYR